MTFRNSFYAGALAAAFVGLWLARLWQSEKQVRLHSEHLLQQIEERDWSAADGFFSVDYRDDWGHDRAQVRDRLRQILRCFTSLTMTEPAPQASATSSQGWWSAKLHLEGQGCEYAPEIMNRVNGLREPFVLHWRQESWRPWDWKLVRVSNPALELSGRER